MQYARVVALCVLLAGSIAGIALANRGPSTPEERRMAVKLNRELEQNPLSSTAPASRAWLATWLTDIPDISLRPCTELVRPLLRARRGYSRELVEQLMFSSVAYLIEHPDRVDDPVALARGGLEGVLRTYEAILRIKPNEHHPFLDDLLVRRDEGTLGVFVEDGLAKCANVERTP